MGDVKLIRSMYKPHIVMVKDLAKQFNVSKITIQRIVNNKSWTGV